jgi:hypothetical protein
MCDDDTRDNTRDGRRQREALYVAAAVEVT